LLPPRGNTERVVESTVASAASTGKVCLQMNIQTKLISFVVASAVSVGCAAQTPEQASDESNAAVSADVEGNATCSPERANGAVADGPKALLDTIAWSEGTAGRGSDGYNVIVGFQFATDCTRHPDRVVKLSKTLTSSAAGRYQFLFDTWNSLGFGAFFPENQQKAGLKLVTRRGVTVPADRAMTATEFSNALSRLSYEWASLPPSRYGQSAHTMAAERAEYCKNAGCDQ
jgi:muramidase (phage lysozyme)